MTFHRFAPVLTLVLGLAVAACGQSDPESSASESDTADGPQCPIDRPVMFSGYNWESNEFHVAVASYILREGFGCKTDLLPGESVFLLEALRRGDIDIAMEVWVENNPDIWERMVSEGKAEAIGVNFPDAVQGWWVPRYVIEGDPDRNIDPVAPDLKSVFDLPKYKEVFQDPEEPSKGRFYNCIAGWTCEIINTKKLHAYGLEDHYTNFRPGSGSALAAAIAGEYRRGKPIVAYFWRPTSLLAKHDMVMLDEPPYDEAVWAEMVETDKPERAVAYPTMEILIGVNTRFKAEAGEIMDFLRRYKTTSDLIHEGIALMADGGSAEDAALAFLKSHGDVWTTWVTPEQAERVRASLE